MASERATGALDVLSSFHRVKSRCVGFWVGGRPGGGRGTPERRRKADWGLCFFSEEVDELPPGGDEWL